MIVINDFPAITHAVQIMWFLVDEKYEVSTIAENASIQCPDDAILVADSTATSKATLIVNNHFTSVVTRTFVEKCRDPTKTYSLSAALFHPVYCTDASSTSPSKGTSLSSSLPEEKSSIKGTIFSIPKTYFFVGLGSVAFASLVAARIYRS